MSDWWFKADYFESCNCDYGCPCNLDSIPTQGSCKGINAWAIKEGAYREVRLDGLRLAIFVHWPNPIHQGNGTITVFIDDRADDRQQEALAQIGTGAAGPGGPFEIFASTCTETPSVVVGKFGIEHEGRTATLQFGDMGFARLSPIKSKMDGSKADARLVLPNGFIFQDAHIVNTDSSEIDMGNGITYRNQDSSAFIGETAYNVRAARGIEAHG